MAVELHRILIEDPEDNFLYVDVRSSAADVALLLEIINNRSSGKAKIEARILEQLTPGGRHVTIADLVSQWHATAELTEQEIQLTIYRTDDPGPMKEWRPAQVILLDEAHATELLGTLALALEKKRQLAGEPSG